MLKNNPLITVYITNYNYGNFIKKAIKSVLNQSFKDFELIIIDDGSKDKSIKIIKEFENKKNIKIVIQKNKGLIVSNNLALRLSRAKYIMRLDSDDWLDPYALEIMSNVLERNKKISLVFPDYYEVNKNGKILKQIIRHDFNKVKLLDQPAHGACTMIRKENLIDIGGYDEEFSCQDGYYLWLKFIKKYMVKNINLPLFYYRQHEKSLTKNNKKIYSNRSQIISKLQNKNNKKNVLSILPIRGLELNPNSLVLKKLKRQPLVFFTINSILNSKLVNKLVITSPDEKILKILKNKYKNKIILLKRPKNLGLLNTELEKTIKHTLQKARKMNLKFDYIMQMSFRTPFITTQVIDDAINTLQLFNSDKIISVTQENHQYYKHNGSGLKSLTRSSNLKLERDTIYKQVMGFSIIKKNKIAKDEELKIGHIVLTNKQSFEINTEEDLKISNEIYLKE
jgi:glycosyltransferase involved in cell wall biosynthesis